MPQPNRAKSGNTSKHLASVNFPEDLLEYIDNLAKELNINRSSLVCIILEDFKKSGKRIRFEVVIDQSKEK